jgi:hypothetical protein
MQGPFNAKVPDSGVYQNGLWPLHLDWMPRRIEKFPSASMLYRLHVSLDSAESSVHCGCWVSSFFYFHPSLCYMPRHSFSPSVYYVHTVMFIYFYFPWNHSAYFVISLVLYIKMCPLTLCIL